MSSHHYVKEGQEPALIIANGESCTYDLLVSVMEWCPFIVVLDGAYNRVIDLQIRPDVVIGDFDSIQISNENITTEYIKNFDQESTDLEKGIDYLLSKGFSDINVLWATGKRLDHTINNFATLAKHKDHRIILYDDHSKAFVLPKTFSKVYNKGDQISLVPVNRASGITTLNLEYSLQNEALEFGKRSGTSNRVKSTGEITISYKEGTLLLIESID